MVLCSFKSKYWNLDLKKETEFECENEKQPQSDKCIFHDLNFLNNEKNFEILEKEFQKKINECISKIDNNPLFCIGYQLYNTNIQDKEFPNPVYFNKANISGLLTINSKFLNHVSFDDAQFSGGDVSFGGAQFSGGHVSFFWTKFSCKGKVYFGDTKFSGGDVSFGGAQFSGGDVSFKGAQFSGEGYVSFYNA